MYKISEVVLTEESLDILPNNTLVISANDITHVACPDTGQIFVSVYADPLKKRSERFLEIHTVYSQLGNKAFNEWARWLKEKLSTI